MPAGGSLFLPPRRKPAQTPEFYQACDFPHPSYRCTSYIFLMKPVGMGGWAGLGGGVRAGHRQENRAVRLSFPNWL